MFDNNYERELSENEIKRINKEYIEQHGMGGFFKLLSELFPRSIDKEDVKRYEEELKIEREAVAPSNEYIEELDLSPKAQSIKESGLYDPKDISAVLEDYANQTEDVLKEEKSKTRILENPNIPVSHSAEEIKVNIQKNPWGDDIQRVEPGYFKSK